MVRRGAVAVLLLLCLASVAVISWIAGARSGETIVVEEPAPPVTQPVEIRTVRDQVTVPAQLRFLSAGTVRGHGGTVTAVVTPGTVVDEGAAILEVNLEPVILLQGERPMFREWTLETHGEDVAQFHRALDRLGSDVEPSSERYNQRSRAAWRALRDAMDAPTTDDVGVGDIVFTPNLPALVGDELPSVGDPADGPLVELLQPDPIVVAVLPSAAATSVEVGADVTVHAGTAILEGVVARTEIVDGGVEVEVRGDFADLDLRTGLRVAIELRESSLAGPVVPTTALRAGSNGRVVIDVLRDGVIVTVPVTILESSPTDARVEGELDEGDEVVVG